MEYSGLMVVVDEPTPSNVAESQSQAVATRQAQRTASKARRAQEADNLRLEVRLSPSAP